MSRKPSGPFLQRKTVTKRPTTTGGSPIPVLTTLTTNFLPGNRVSATIIPVETPNPTEMSVAIPDTLRDSQVMPRTSGSSAHSSLIAVMSPSRMRSIYSPSDLGSLPASGKNRGAPYLLTPKVFMVFWVFLDTMKPEKAFAPEAFTLGHLAGLTWMT